MKKFYEKPVIDEVLFDTNNILTESMIEEGGDLEALQANLLKRGIDLNEVQLYLRDRA